MGKAGIRILMGVLALCAAFPAAAQEFVSTHGDWSVFTVSRGGNTVCYIASAPVSSTGNYTRRGDPYVLVTHRTQAVDEVSASSGYPYKDASKTRVDVDGRKFEMFTKEELAWAFDTDQDRAMVDAMKKGNRMTVRGTSPRNTYSIDTYSLRGITAAYNKMKSLCD